MIVAICIIGYLLMIFGFCLWDAWIGMPVEWGYDAPPLLFCAFFWPILLPHVAAIAFSNYLDRAKKERLKLEEHKQKVRIAVEKEIEKYNEEVEEEVRKLIHEGKK